MTSPDTRRQHAVSLGPHLAFLSCTALHHRIQTATTAYRAASMQTGTEAGGAVPSTAATAAAAAGRCHSQRRPPQPHPAVDVRRSGGATAAAGVSPGIQTWRHAPLPPWLLRWRWSRPRGAHCSVATQQCCAENCWLEAVCRVGWSPTIFARSRGHDLPEAAHNEHQSLP